MAILSNLGVMLIPPLAGLEILQHIHQGTYFVAPSVNPAFGGTHALTLNKISHFWMDTTLVADKTPFEA
jgi:hypothetical protein